MPQSTNSTSHQSASGDIRLRVNGMDCAEEIGILKKELIPLVVDADRLQFDVLNRKLTVRQGSPSISQAEVISAVKKTGMSAEVWTDSSVEASDDHDHATKRGLTSKQTTTCH